MSGPSLPLDTPYAEWTHEQLLERVLQLEKRPFTAVSQPGTPFGSSSEGSEASTPTKGPLSRQARRGKREYDPSKYAHRHIALKIAYLGGAYHGLALQDGKDEHIPTIEKFVFHALRTTRLVPPEAGSTFNYSRCGRTDRGVSALGQVIGLHVRSNQDRRSPLVLRTPEFPEADPGVEERTEIPYVDLLNKLLPPDIRVLAWSPVAVDFNARFSCTSREYRYYIPLRGMSLPWMQEAAGMLEGAHDFRNFCKIDPTKNVLTHDRTVKVSEVLLLDESDSVPLGGGGGRGADAQWAVYRVVGSAFLWHQVRCMAALIMLVGSGLEPLSTIPELLSTDRTPSRPAYDLASEIPLVLHSCTYPEGVLRWVYTEQTRGSLERVWRGMRSAAERRYTDFLVLDSFQRSMRAELWDEEGDEEEGEFINVIMGGGEFFRSRTYQPVMNRKRCLGVEEHNVLREQRKAKKARLNPLDAEK